MQARCSISFLKVNAEYVAVLFNCRKLVWHVLNVHIYCCVTIESATECGIFDNGCVNTSAANRNAADWH